MRNYGKADTAIGGGCRTTAGAGLLAALFLGLASPVALTASQAQLAIRGVSVVDAERGQVVSNQTILVEAGVISAVGPAAETAIPPTVQVLSGNGLYASPGLADLHAHAEADDLPLFLANGVTTVREMNGSSEALALRAEIRAGARPGPTLFVASPLLAGVEQRWRHRLLKTPAEARKQLADDRIAGFDSLKVYDGLSSETYETILEMARELGLPVVGHIPRDVGLERVLDSDQRSIEHVEQIANATVGHATNVSAIPAIVQQIRSGLIAVTPTLAAMEVLSSQQSIWFDDLYERGEMRYTPTGVRGWWESLRRPTEARGALAVGPVGGDSKRVVFFRELTRALADAGVPILVGTDTPNPLLVPGFSVHHELEALVRAGLEPARVLRAATFDAAVHLEAADEFGALKPGLRADIVLTSGNPLDDISRLRQLEGVIVRGEWYPRDRLEELLESVESARAPEAHP